MRALSVLAAAALVMMVTVAPSAQAPTSAADAASASAQRATADRSGATPVTFTKDVAPILQRSCQNCHRPDPNAPMSLMTLRGRAPVRAIDQGEDGLAPDAAVAHRAEHRHSEIQGRSVADRAGNRDDRGVGRSGRAEGRHGRHAAAQEIRGRRRVAHRQARSHRRDSAASTSCRQPAPTCGSITSPTAGSPKIATCRPSRRSRGRARERSCITC